MTRLAIFFPPLLVFFLIRTVTASAQQNHPTPPISDETRDELGQLHDESRAHAEAGRHAIAFTGFMELHTRMAELHLPRASVALWDAGLALTHVNGREREARDILQRFLADSTHLAAEADVADFRSRAMARIAEIDVQLSINLDPQSALSEPGPAAIVPASATTISPIGPIVLGVGVTAVVAGIIAGAVAGAQGDSLRAMCPGLIDCADSLRGPEESMFALGTAADVLWIGGAIAAVVGTILTFTLREGGTPPASAACSSHRCRTELGWRW